MDVITHKCPNCGGALTFDPGDQKFHCPFCLSIFTEAEVTAFEQKQKEAQLADGTAPENQPITDDTEPALKAITEKPKKRRPKWTCSFVLTAAQRSSLMLRQQLLTVISATIQSSFPAVFLENSYLTKFYLLQSKRRSNR